MPRTNQFQVNQVTTGAQGAAEPAVSEELIVVSFHDSQANRLKARFYDKATGEPLTSVPNELFLNHDVSNSPGFPRVAIDRGTAWVVAWLEDWGMAPASDLVSPSIHAIRYQLDSQTDTQFEVNQYRRGVEMRPDVASGRFGSFLIVWEVTGSNLYEDEYPGSDFSGSSIHGRFYTSTAAPASDEMELNFYKNGNQEAPVATGFGVNALERFAVAWVSESSPTDPFGTSVHVRCFEANGTPMSAIEIQANDETAGNQHAPRIAGEGAGFVVGWNSGAPNVIRAQRFDTNCAKVGANLSITETTDELVLEDVAVDKDRNFIVLASNVSLQEIRAKAYDTEGQVLAPSTLVNQIPTFGVARMDSGAFGQTVAAWNSPTSAGTDNSGDSVQARVFQSTISFVVFEDGFESGDTSKW